MRQVRAKTTVTMDFMRVFAIMPQSRMLWHERGTLPGCASIARALSRQIEGLDDLAVADIEPRADQRRRRPRDAFEHCGFRQHFELLGADFAKGQGSILIGEDDLAICVQ